MIQMLLKMRHVVSAALFLWLIVLGLQGAALRWVILPIIAYTAVLIFSEFVERKYPQFGWKIRLQAQGLLLLYALAFTGLPWLETHFPKAYDAIVQRKASTDRQAAGWLGPCLNLIQGDVYEYTQGLERAEAANIKRELDALLKQAADGTPPDRVREEAVKERIRALARNRAEWRSLEKACDPATTPAVEPTGSSQPTRPAGAFSPPPQPAPAPSNGGGGNGTLHGRNGGTTPAPTAPPTPRPVRYFYGAAPSGHILALEPSADPAVAAELNSALKTRLGSFTAEFFSDGAFSRLFAGDGSPLPALTLAPGSILYACRSTIQFGKGHESSADLRRADVRLTCRRMDPQSGTHQMIDGSGTGTGFSDQQASQIGIERAAKLLGERLTRL